MQNSHSLFSPLQLGTLKLPNRIVMAPLTRNRADQYNSPQQLNAEYYLQRASAGLIISEATQVSTQGVGYPGTPGIHHPVQVSGWRTVTDAVHEKGGRIFLQLWHVGRISHPSFQQNAGLPVAPSAIRAAGECLTEQGLQAFVEPRALETHEISSIVEQYAVAARNAKVAGFDGVEIHAANGYLLDQFLRDSTNHRKDAYGGNLENRTRFLVDVITAILEVWDAGRVGVRISPENRFNDIDDSDPQTTFNYLTEKLNNYNLAYLHVLEGDMTSAKSVVDYSQIRQRFNGKYMANNGYTQAKAQTSIQLGNSDLVAFGTLYIANPDLVERFEDGSQLNVADPNTFYGGHAKGYTDYPFRNSV